MSLLREALRKAEQAQEEARQLAGPRQLALEPVPASEPVAPELHPAPSQQGNSGSNESLEPIAVTTVLDPAPDGPEADMGEARSGTPTSRASPTAERAWSPNPGRPFQLALASLVLVAVGGAGYFWIQLRAPSPIAHSMPSRSPGEAAAAQAKPAAAERLASVEETLASLSRPAAVTPGIEDAVQGGETAALDSHPPLQGQEMRAAMVPRTDAIVLPRPSAGVRRWVEEGSEARLQTEDPRRLKTIPGDPRASAALHSFLGGQHARTGRWSEAQSEFARAFASDPGNPDLAFNLAVSLDRLQRKQEAAVYYEHALRLRKQRPAHFPADAARERMRHLAREPS